MSDNSDYSRHYFYFKQFKIRNRNSAFKINTDGVLLGCWAKLNQNDLVLEVGTGTSVIAHLLSYRFMNTKITAIEIDQKSCTEAIASVEENQIQNIQIINADLNSFQSNHKFNHIICNPPYFSNSTLPTDIGLKIAKHSPSLNYEQLLYHSAQLSKESAKLSVIIPFGDEENFIKRGEEYNFKISRILRIRPRIKSINHRSLIELSLNSNYKKAAIREVYMHEEGQNNYSEAYVSIVGDYYLKM